jgi:DNA adenine methylase
MLIMSTGIGIVNVAAVKHLSPFRYPGGKTWLVPYVRQWISSLPNRPLYFIEPFAGGAIVGLTIAYEKLADHVILIEKDKAVAAVWRTILGRDWKWLKEKLLTFNITRQNVLNELAETTTTCRALAFQTILRNRVQRGGILAPGASLMLKGENGRGVASRWYPETLAARIDLIQQIKDRITFMQGDAFKIIPQYLSNPATAWFIDPPYTAGGKSAGSRLYAHNEIDHHSLFAVMASAPGTVLMTYDDAPEVRQLSKLHRLKCGLVPMKNTHHEIMHELVISKQADAPKTSPRVAVARYMTKQLQIATEITPKLPSQATLFSA